MRLAQKRGVSEQQAAYGNGVQTVWGTSMLYTRLQSVSKRFTTLAIARGVWRLTV